MDDRVARETRESEGAPDRQVARAETDRAAMALNRDAARGQHHRGDHHHPAGREETHGRGQRDAPLDQRMVVERAGEPGRVGYDDQGPGERNERPQSRLRGQAEA